MPAHLERSCPLAGAVVLAIHREHNRTGAMDDKLAQVNVTAFTDPQQGRLSARGVLSGHQSEPSRQLSTVLEGVDVTDRGQQGGGDLGSDAGDRLLALHALIRPSPPHATESPPQMRLWLDENAGQQWRQWLFEYDQVNYN